MNLSPTVSIVIPIYNKEETLRKCIDSVLKQSFKNFELILIDDGSRDNSFNIALNYAANDFRVRCFHNENQGVAASRNQGIELARGEYVSFLDADDEYKASFLEKMVERVKNYNVCYCGHYFVKNNKSKKARIKFCEGDILLNYVNNKCTPNTNSWLIRKEFLDEYKIRFTPSISWGEDMLFFLKVLWNEKEIKSVKAFLTKYYLDVNGSLSANSIGKIEQDLYWMNLAEQYIKTNSRGCARSTDVLRAFETYRKPASIIYRVYRNRYNSSCISLVNNSDLIKKYLENFQVTNGIRSIKLAIYRVIVLRYIT